MTLKNRILIIPIILSLTPGPLALNAMHTDKKQKIDTESKEDLERVTIMASLVNALNKSSSNALRSNALTELLAGCPSPLCALEESYSWLPCLGSKERAASDHMGSDSCNDYELIFTDVYNNPKDATIQLRCLIKESADAKLSEKFIIMPYNTGIQIPYENENQENNTSAPQSFILRIENTVIQ